MSLSPFGRALKASRAIRVYKDGDAHGFVWRWWNPVAWIVAPPLILFAIGMQGAPETFRNLHYIGIGMKPWFIQHPDRLEWVP